MLPEGHRYRKRLARPHSLFIMHFAVLAGRDIQPNLILVVQHDAITANVLDTGFWIAGNDEMGRTQIAPTVARVPARHGKLRKINLIATLDVFKLILRSFPCRAGTRATVGAI